MIYENDFGTPNYNPNSFLNASAQPQYKESAYRLDSGLGDIEVDRYEEPNYSFFQVNEIAVG